MMLKSLLTSISTLALAGVALGAGAAELGDVAPRSYIGQPLAVDIDLVALTPEEVAGLQVRLADGNVYRGANVTMNPALASVRLQVERRGAKSVLHVTTTRPVEADYVHLYVELGVPGKQDVRLATVWLQKDPNPPAPVVAPVVPAVPLASAMTAAQAEQITAQAKAARAATAAAVKPAVAEVPAAAPAVSAPVRDRSKPAPLPSVHEAEAGAPGEVKAAGRAQRIAGVWVDADGKVLKTQPRDAAPEVPVGVAQALLPLGPLPLPKGVRRPQASCAPSGISAKECVALDNHNAELSSKLLELEGKMKVLQGALGGAAPVAAKMAAAPAAAATVASASASAAASLSAQGATEMSAAKTPVDIKPSAAASASAVASAASAPAPAPAPASASAAASVAPSGPVKQIRVLPKLKYKKEKPPEQPTDYTLPLAAGGVGLLALLGAGYLWWRRKQSGRGPLQIWQGFRKKKPAGPDAPAPAAASATEAAAEPVAS